MKCLLPMKKEEQEGLLPAQKEVRDRNIDFRNVLGSKPKKKDFEDEPGKLKSKILYQSAIREHIRQLMLLAVRDEGKMIPVIRHHLKKYRLNTMFMSMLNQRKLWLENEKRLKQLKLLDQVIAIESLPEE